jgi:trehalose 6-phosphate phosphatase
MQRALRRGLGRRRINWRGEEDCLDPESAKKLDVFFRTFAGSAHPVLLLDYDGTLSAFRVNRFEARPFAGVRELLERIQREGRTRMAVITGRPAEEIGPMLGLEAAVEVWGLHGAERLYPNGRRELDPAPVAAQQKLNEVRERLHQDSLGGRFEDKPNAAVMHWRGVPPHKARAIEQRTRQLFEPLAEMDGLGLLEFEAGLELRVGRDKGGAVEAIVAEAEPGAPVAYLGDDLTDESAFHEVNALDGPHLSVLMRHSWRETEADVWLRPPEELRGFLRDWLRAARG